MERVKRAFQTFVGVDLGGGRGKTTAVARLEATADGTARVVEVGTRTRSGELWYDDALVSCLRSYSAGTVVAVDAPLTLTACVRCVERLCPGQAVCEVPAVAWMRQTTARHAEALAVAEQALAVREQPRSMELLTHDARSKPRFAPYAQRATELYLHQSAETPLRDSTGPLGARAQHLMRRLTDLYRLNENLLEVSPRLTVHQLFGARIARRYRRSAETWSTRARVLEGLSQGLQFAVWRESCLQNDHCFDAVLCAYTAFLWARDGWTLPEEGREVFEQDGWIWHPPAPLNRPGRE
jgi:hypothetical protein